MEDTSTRNKHTGKPGNGGHFDSKHHDEAETSLQAPLATPAADRMMQIDSLRWGLTEKLQRAAEDTIVETAAKYPNAVVAEFVWVDDFDGSSLQFVSLNDADGEGIDVDISDESIFSDAARTFEDDFDTVRKASAFEVNYDEDDSVVTLDLKGHQTPGYVTTVMNAERIVESAEKMSAFADSELAAAGATGVKAVARQAFPDAQTVVIGDGSDGSESPYFVVREIQDGNGDTLWGFDDEDENAVADHLAQFAPLLDRGPNLWEGVRVDLKLG
jgi:hypothetical protein